jgi:chromosome segregation ATPase
MTDRHSPITAALDAHQNLLEEHAVLRKELQHAQEQLAKAHEEITLAVHETDRLRIQVHDLTDRAMKAEIEARNAARLVGRWQEKIDRYARMLVADAQEIAATASPEPQDEPKPNGGGVARVDAEKRLSELGRTGKIHEVDRETRLRRLFEKAEEETSGV